MKANDKKMRAWQKIKIALGVLIMVFSFVACTSGGGGYKPLEGEIEGNADLPYTKVGVEYDAGVTVGGVSVAPKSMSSKITKNNNGRVESTSIIALNTEQVNELDKLIGTTHFPVTKKIQKLKELGFKVNMEDPNNLIFENTAKAKVTDEGIQLFDSRKEEEGSLVTLIKYDAKVGDTYEYTDSKGYVFNTKVVHIDDEPTYALKTIKKQRNGRAVISTQKVKIYKTEGIVPSSSYLFKYAKKGEYFFCKEYGLVKIRITLVSDEVIEIDLNPNISTGGGTSGGNKEAKIVIVNEKAGQNVKIEPDANMAAELSAYIDLNNNGKEDEGEKMPEKSEWYLFPKKQAVVYGTGIKRFTIDYGLNTVKVEPSGDMFDLRVRNTKITTLNLKNCPNLEFLNCSLNEIESLDVTMLRDLVSLQCNVNQIESLDVTALKKLKSLGCRGNKLKELNVNAKNNPELNSIYCGSNKLTSLDLTGLSISQLHCEKNNLKSLIVTDVYDDEYTDTHYIYCHFNQLKGESVTKFVDNLPKLPANKKGIIGFIAASNNKKYPEEQNSATKAQVAKAKSKGWVFKYTSGSYNDDSYEGE